VVNVRFRGAKPVRQVTGTGPLTHAAAVTARERELGPQEQRKCLRRDFLHSRNDKLRGAESRSFANSQTIARRRQGSALTATW
jgi:hypothetical protein